MIDYRAHPLEAGMEGDPWRIVLCIALCSNGSTKAVRQMLKQFLTVWPTAGMVAEVPLEDLHEALDLVGVSYPWRRARLLRKLAGGWTRMVWDKGGVFDLEDVRQVNGITSKMVDALVKWARWRKL